MPVETYRLHRFGTILLTPEQKESAYLMVRVASQVRRAEEYKNFRWLPNRIPWLNCTAIDKDGYVFWYAQANWYREGWVLWERQYIIPINQCKIGNALYSQIMTELAKKPNIPPLPPSVPPTSDLLDSLAPVKLPGITALLFESINDGDFDVSINWATPVSPSACSPPPLDPESPGAIASQLPPPAPNMPAPPPLNTNQPARLPTGSPPIAGTSIVPPGFSPGYQSQDGIPRKTRVFVRYTVVNPCNKGCSVIPQIEIQAWDFPGTQETGWTATVNAGSGVCPGTGSGFSIRKDGAVLLSITASTYAVAIESVFVVPETSPVPAKTIIQTPC